MQLDGDKYPLEHRRGLILGVAIALAGSGPAISAETNAQQPDMIVDVRSRGAKGDGISDDTTSIEDAIAAANGRAVYFKPGIYAISRPINIPDNTTLVGPSKKLYPNFSSDWMQRETSWSSECAVLQYVAGRHGALFEGGKSLSVEGLVFRSGQKRSALDRLYHTAVSHVRFMNCVFQNLEQLAGTDESAWGAWQFSGNIVVGCATAFSGAMVDMQISNNVFTSLASSAIALHSGAGANIIDGNRFEWGKCGLIIGRNSRSNIISENIFDAHDTFAISISGISNQNTISNNIFWRNGRSLSAAFGNSAHIVFDQCEPQPLQGNIFMAGNADGGGKISPLFGIDLNKLTSDLNLDANQLDSRSAVNFPVRIAGSELAGFRVKAVGTIDLRNSDPALLLNRIKACQIYSSAVREMITVLINQDIDLEETTELSRLRIVAVGGERKIQMHEGNILIIGGLDGIRISGLYYESQNEMQLVTGDIDKCRVYFGPNRLVVFEAVAAERRRRFWQELEKANLRWVSAQA